MSNTKFTPGPWAISDYDYGEQTLYIKATDVFPFTICAIKSTRRKEVDEQANAHLIAAAPELYEALINCVNALIAYSNTDEIIEVVRAKAALKKANP